MLEDITEVTQLLNSKKGWKASRFCFSSSLYNQFLMSASTTCACWEMFSLFLLVFVLDESDVDDYDGM